MFRSLSIRTIVVGVAFVAAGCNRTETPSQPSAKESSILLKEKPEGARGVLLVRKKAKDKDDVVIEGRVGGSEKPIVQGMAAFTIVDPSVAACPPEENCPTPWDYCCTPPETLKPATATVKFVTTREKFFGRT